MTSSKYKQPYFFAHLIGLIIIVFSSISLTFVYLFVEMALYKSVVMTIFVLSIVLTNIMAALAFRRIGHSPWLALTGFLIGLVPLILYIALPDKSSSSA